MDIVKRFWGLIVVGIFLFFVISFARNVMTTQSTVYSWYGVASWILIIGFVWFVIFVFLALKKNKTEKFFKFGMDEVSILPRKAGTALYVTFWISMLAFSAVVFVLGIALFDKYVPFEFLKWVAEQAKLLIGKK
jgi:hypothetical protein